MSIFDGDIYERVRTRTIVLHRGSVLLLEPWGDEAAWHPPGGGLEPNESLAECAAREVFEETGVRVTVGPVAFLREWVAPKYCLKDSALHGYGLEVFFYATPSGDTATRRESEDDPRAEWVPLERVPSLRLWPNELKALAQHLCDGGWHHGAPAFARDLMDSSLPALPASWEWPDPRTAPGPITAAPEV